MQYRTVDYLRDSYWLINLAVSFWEAALPKLKKTLDAAIEFEWDYYIFRIVDNLPYALLFFFLGFLSIFTLTKYTEKGSGIRVATITTNSMSDSISPGSLVITAPSEVYRKDEVITYKEKNLTTGIETGRVITHRIIEVKEKNSFITKGDANSYPDPGEVNRSQVLGKVLYVFPNLGYVDIILKTLPGFIIFIVVPSLLLIKSEVGYLKSELKKSDNAFL